MKSAIRIGDQLFVATVDREKRADARGRESAQYVARSQALKGLDGVGDTVEEAVDNLQAIGNQRRSGRR